MAERGQDGRAGGARAIAAPQGAPSQQKEATAADPGREGSALAAAHGFIAVHAAAGATEPPPQFPMTPTGFMALQRMVGNRAVARAMERFVQRVPVAYSGGETLYNQQAPGGKAGAANYGGSGTFQLTRDADAGVSVEVKIKFLKQARNTIKPRPGTADPAVGDLTGPQTELPAGDRAWATTTAEAAVKHWNDRLTLVGKDVPRPDAAEVEKRLKVTFKATPKFLLADVADSTVIVHPPGVIGGSTGNPIDAGNYYMKKDDSVYPDSDAMIYAHEYGHLMGINDEYSQSNEQMNLLIHRAAPGTAASSMAALDKKTVELMVLASLTPPLFKQLKSSMGVVTNAIRSQKKAVKAKMIAAAKAAARSPEIGELLTNRLTAMSTTPLHRQVPKAVALQTTSNFGHVAISTEGVDKILAPGGIGKIVGDSYGKALTAPQGENVNVPGLGDVKIDVQSSIYQAAGKSGPAALRSAAKGAAEGAVGKTGPGLPKLPPPETLVGQLAAVPGSWTAAGGAVETGITPATFAAKMKATLEAATAAAVAGPPPAAAPKPTIRSGKMLYIKAWVLVNNAAREAVRQLTSELVTSTMDPVLAASVTNLRASITTEVTKAMTMTPSQLAASPNPDPNMRAIVGDMKGRLDAAKTALKGTGMDPLGTAGATTPAQDVTYSYQGMMGSGKTAAMRTDQFQMIVDNFNSKLKLPTESNFTSEVKAA